MATEIERKFLVRDDSWRSSVDSSVEIRQGYLAGSEKSSIRVRVADDKANINIKSATLDVTRVEYEFKIPLTDALEMLDNLCEDPLIEKTRFHVQHGVHLWEVDVFGGENQGLVVAEIELGERDEEFDRPEWLGEEVSSDPRYYNVCLVKHPYKDW